VGRAANSRRTAQARSRRLRTHGVALSPRTAERPSQTWRTFIVNHLGQFEFDTQMLSTDVSGDDLVDADASPSTSRPISSDRLPMSRQRALVDGRVSPEAQVLAYLALRITFADARACEGAPAGLRRGLEYSGLLQWMHGGHGEGRFVPSDRATATAAGGDCWHR
jgi:hypothetical protein